MPGVLPIPAHRFATGQKGRGGRRRAACAWSQESMAAPRPSALAGRVETRASLASHPGKAARASSSSCWITGAPVGIRLVGQRIESRAVLFDGGWDDGYERPPTLCGASPRRARSSWGRASAHGEPASSDIRAWLNYGCGPSGTILRGSQRETCRRRLKRTPRQPWWRKHSHCRPQKKSHRNLVGAVP